MAVIKQLKHLANYQSCIASHLTTDESVEFLTTVDYLSFLLEGSIQVTINNKQQTLLDSPTMFLIPKEMNYKRTAIEPSKMITFPIVGQALTFSLLSINKERLINMPAKKELSSLELGDLIQHILSFFVDSFTFSFLDQAYYDLKLTELFYLIKEHYTEKERIQFFAPIIDDDFLFSDFIMNNYKRATNIKDLAALSCYSLSGFDKRFRKVFGEAPFKWLNDHKKNGIYGELFDTNKTLKQIASEYGFCSLAHFNNYCKLVFGMSPGEIRKKELKLNV